MYTAAWQDSDMKHIESKLFLAEEAAPHPQSGGATSPNDTNEEECMRKYAYLREPLEYNDGNRIYKIMLYKAKEGFYLFEYCSLDAIQCTFDRYYDSLDDLYEDWNDSIDERGWIEIEDPLPDCQHDAFIPIRVKSRDVGKPEWGKFETLSDGKWIEYMPNNPL